ncbi:uncharacterized mitochondrial protein AtMg00810-like [Cannabis sativa]|uniref:uncharacterized mitochondrial protein AtMg00810-like n=1 Tax=Cannabis sativa TaxID=3483 RepID=UPI0029C9C60A|nr:uncharacterized mitochondrial protein AtMg00810-like [Cannabis sativa]
MWYFDSGCSRHMIGEKEYLENIRPMQCGDVTFEEQIEDLLEKPAAEEKDLDEATEAFVEATVQESVATEIPTTKESDDADWAGNADDRKRTSDGCFYLGNNLVSWHNKKQNSISLSTAEAEYIVVGTKTSGHCGF